MRHIVLLLALVLMGMGCLSSAETPASDTINSATLPVNAQPMASSTETPRPIEEPIPSEPPTSPPQDLPATPVAPPQTGCTEEAKMCEDGTVVVRTGPNCEFEACQDTPIRACTDDQQFCADDSVRPRNFETCEWLDCPEEVTVSISVTAKNWEFVPAQIEVEKGNTVELSITSIDVDHSFALPAFGINTKLSPNQTSVVTFTADKTGSFPFSCKVFCGEGHKGMNGVLIVK